MGGRSSSASMVESNSSAALSARRRRDAGFLTLVISWQNHLRMEKESWSNQRRKERSSLRMRWSSAGAGGTRFAGLGFRRDWTVSPTAALGAGRQALFFRRQGGAFLGGEARGRKGKRVIFPF